MVRKPQIYLVNVRKKVELESRIAVEAMDADQAYDTVEGAMRSGVASPLWVAAATPGIPTFSFGEIEQVDRADPRFEIMAMLSETGGVLTIDEVLLMGDVDLDRLLEMELKGGFAFPIADLDRGALDQASSRRPGPGSCRRYSDLACLVEFLASFPEAGKEQDLALSGIRIDRKWTSEDDGWSRIEGWTIVDGRRIAVTGEDQQRPRPFRDLVTDSEAFGIISHLAAVGGSDFHRRALLEIGRGLGLTPKSSRIADWKRRPQQTIEGMERLIHQIDLEATASWVTTNGCGEFHLAYPGKKPDQAVEIGLRFQKAMEAIGAPVHVGMPTSGPRCVSTITFKDEVALDLETVDLQPRANAKVPAPGF